MRYPVLSKTMALLGVVLALLWALNSVSSVVRERQGRLQEAEQSVADSLASQQTLVGPVVKLVCTENWEVPVGEGKERHMSPSSEELTYLLTPQSLAVKGSIDIEPRHRGIFKINGYALNATLRAQWADGALAAREPRHGGTVACGSPNLMVAVSDSRGIRVARVKVNGQALDVAPGSDNPRHPRGFRAALPSTATVGAMSAEITLGLVGTQNLAIAPLGDTTHVNLTSNWPHPSFAGHFLPTDRQITAKGFEANWQLSSLATTAQQAYVSGARACELSEHAGLVTGEDKSNGALSCIETFGVNFMDPVNPYVLSDRATKYGLLFIVLTFVSVALVEVMRRLRVHPVQYLLVGSALTVFFLLLVSLTEHLPFAGAYLIASSACTALLAFYGSHLLGHWVRGLVFGGGVALLYGALYVLLQLEQSSLVLGSALLFVVLALIMTVTRKLNWYELAEQLRAERPPAVGP
jgi:inner membrane protein